ncbi:MAG: hypothetical protein CSA62_01035 [Planctomycetota bacterium]|nr:MAG: hypothetical protein CSA62_01035 [Planctomycetota bacterium]
MFSALRLPLFVAALLLPLACGGKKPDLQKPEKSQVTIPEKLWSAEKLGDAQDVAKVRKDAEDGSEVVVVGKVKDFVEGLASLTLVDLVMKSCDQKPGDMCKTPWDYCCEDPTKMALSTISIEVVDAKDHPLRCTLKGFHKLEHLDILEVKGTVHRDSAGNVRLSVSRIARR